MSDEKKSSTTALSEKAVLAVTRFIPNTRMVNLLFDIATIIVCVVSVLTTMSGLATVMDSEEMAKWVAIAMGGAIAMIWVGIGHWLPYADEETQRKSRISILVFCLLVFFGSTLFSVITVGGKDAVAVGEQTTINDAFGQGLKYYQEGQRERTLTSPLRTYKSIFEQLAEREKFGEVSQATDPKTGKTVFLTGAGIVYANLRTTAQAFESFAEQIENTDRERNAVWKALQDDINTGRDLIIKQNQVHGDYNKWQQLQVEFAGVVGNINKDLAKLASLGNGRFLTEANNRIQDLLTVIGKGSDQQNQALDNIRKPVQSASEVMGKLIADNKSTVTDQVPPMYTIVPMGYAVFRYWNIILYAWAIGLLLDFGPLIILVLKTGFIGSFKKQEERLAAEKKGNRFSQAREELAEARRRRNALAEGTPAWRNADREVQRLKDEVSNLDRERAAAVA